METKEWPLSYLDLPPGENQAAKKIIHLLEESHQTDS
jgi:hypothetical protein